MKTLQRVACMATTGMLLLGTGVSAQVSEDGMGKVLPVELWACTFNEGKGMSDLDALVPEWSAFMDERDVDDYAAWTLLPYYNTTEQAFDMIWMGAWSDGNAMGAGTDIWLSEGGEIAAKFGEIADCQAHIGLASAMFKSPPDNATPQSSVITMMDCEMNEGTDYDDVIKAELEWAEHMNDAGSTAGTWHWFPAFGGGDAEYDYKVVNAYENFSELGKDWQHNANGGGREASADIFGDLDECDDARVYLAKSRRAAQIR